MHMRDLFALFWSQTGEAHHRPAMQKNFCLCVLKQTIGVLAVVCWHTICCLKDCVWYVESGC